MCVSIKYEKNKHAKLGSWYIYIEHLNKHFDIRTTKDENINHRRVKTLLIRNSILSFLENKLKFGKDINRERYCLL